MGRRPLMSVVFRRFTIDTEVIFENKEDESVMEGGVINLQTICAKAGQGACIDKEDFLGSIRDGIFRCYHLKISRFQK